MKYEAVIGLEVHVQAKTKSKMFCACANEFGAKPNTNICPVCMAYPGAMPMPNKYAIQQAIRAGLLTECKIANRSKFDRKSYFYPDSPKNYQTSQFDIPFCGKGRVKIGGGTGFSGEDLPERYVALNRIHLEEDVGKLEHHGGATGVDYNRAGLALLEIVSEPDMFTPDEAHAYLMALRELMQYGGISDCDMEKGQLRCDVNVSLRPIGTEKLGTKVEIKNLNSMRSAHRSLEYEIWRQANELDAGNKILQETRGWNDDRGETYVMRVKESDDDYRYFPDPDLMWFEFKDSDIEEIRKTLPELPAAMRQRFIAEYDLTEYDAEVLTQDQAVAKWFDESAKLAKTPKLVANWITTDLLRELGDAKQTIEECKIKPNHLAELIALIENKTISSRIAKDIFPEMFKSGKAPKTIVEEKGLIQVSDEGAIGEFVDQAIENNPDQVQQYKDGNERVLQYLVGQVMKISRGKANPQGVITALKERLD